MSLSYLNNQTIQSQLLTINNVKYGRASQKMNFERRNFRLLFFADLRKRGGDVFNTFTLYLCILTSHGIIPFLPLMCRYWQHVMMRSLVLKIAFHVSS